MQLTGKNKNKINIDTQTKGIVAVILTILYCMTLLAIFKKD